MAVSEREERKNAKAASSRGATANVKVTSILLAVLAALMRHDTVRAVDGVPEMTPVLLLSVRPMSDRQLAGFCEYAATSPPVTLGMMVTKAPRCSAKLVAPYDTAAMSSAVTETLTESVTEVPPAVAVTT